MESKYRILTALVLFLILSLSVTLISCKNSSFKSIGMKKYEWTTSGQADYFYPALLHKGSFIYEGGSSYIPGKRRVAKGWGESGSTHLSGEEFKPLPHAFSISWVSLAEKKYYKGRFDLPKEKIEKLFKEGYINRLKKQETYNEFKLCVAPGGIIVVWISGGGRTTEIGRYKATEAEITIQEIMPGSVYTSIEDYSNKAFGSLQERKKKKMNWDTIPYDRWDNYRIKHLWKPEFIFKNEGKLTEVVANFFNGEGYYISTPDPIIKDYRLQAIPKYFKLEWVNKTKDYFGSRIYMDETEIFEAYKKIYSDPKIKEAKLIFEIDKYNSEIKIALQSVSEKIPLNKAKVKVYETSN